MKSPKIRFKEFQNEWNSRILGDICSFSKGKGYSKSDLAANGNPIILYGSLYTNYKTVIEKIDTFAKLKENSILSFGDEVIMPSSGETAEDISIASAVKFKNAIIGGDLNILKPKINSIFLAYKLSNGNTKKEISKKAQGKSVVHLYNNDLKNIKIRIPNDIKEQEKIGEFFRKIDGILDLENSRFKKLENFKKTMLDKLFVKDGADEPQIRLSSFKGKWNSRILGDIGEIITGSTPSTEEQENYSQNGMLWVTPSDIKGIITKNTAKKLSKIGIQKARVVPENSILVTCIASIGKNTLVQEPCSFNQQINALVPNKKFHTYFLLTLSSFWSKYMLEKMVGGMMPIVNKQEFSNIETRIPNDIKEQEEIGEFFRKIDGILEFSQKKITKLENIKKYLLNKMFV
ncbi:restriction endonuclease subunit S [Campylobacter sp.]|uniref:restriction endonuclease subunit S n=1 Tax=Campylobacter sp. TaxID=205 RepID=UPI002AA72FBC|nr:restriction endonuclease subunit S [Campylobacter sp.]MCI7077111.1 restriction endonuclease subunit S [Campylobacter sp.]